MRKTSDLWKGEIVATILVLADRISPDRVTTRAVADAVGVTQASVFRHFPSKSAMWSAVANRVADALTAAWDTALAEAGLPVDRIKSLIGAQLGKIAAMPMVLFSREPNGDNVALRVAFRGRLAAFHGHQMREIAEGQQSQTLHGDEAAADSAVPLTSLIQGMAIRWSLGARVFAMRAESMRLLNVQLRLLVANGG